MDLIMPLELDQRVDLEEAIDLNTREIMDQIQLYRENLMDLGYLGCIEL